MVQEEIKAKGGEEEKYEASINDEAENEQKTPRIVRVLEKGMWELKRDPEFEALLAPLEKDELIKLKNAIQRDGCTDSLYTWNKIIVDGHNRYSLCWELKTPFVVTELEFIDRNEAILWIIERQLGRRNISLYKRGELALQYEKMYAQKAKQRMLAGKKAKDPPPNWAVGEEKGDTRDHLAAIAKLGHTTMSRIRKLSNEADEGTKDKLRKGEITINKAFTELFGEKKTNRKKSVKPHGRLIGDEGGDSAEDRATEKATEISIPDVSTVAGEDLHEIETPRTNEPIAVPRQEEKSSVYSESDFTYDRVTKYPGITVLDHPIEIPTNRCDPHQEPRPFIFVQGQVHYAFKNMLKELQIGLDWIMDEDRKRIPELMKMLKSTIAKAEQMLKEMEETDD